MDNHGEAFEQYLCSGKIRAQHLRFAQSCHSVADAARVVGAKCEAFIKSICMVGTTGSLVVGIVRGVDKVSISKAGRAVGDESLRMATAAEVEEKTGFPCGGTPPLGYQATFLVDSRVMENQVVYAGGGSVCSLLRIETSELLRANGGQVLNIRQ